MSATRLGADSQPRCHWCVASADYVAYHDTEWGFPVAEDNRLFEKLSLEGFQAGLSWRTILTKRANFRQAFHDFDYRKIAHFTAAEVQRLLMDTGIVRHRGKIEAVINNAQRAVEIAASDGSLAAFLWRYAPATAPPAGDAPVSSSTESLALAKALKRRGWAFVGPTTVYAFMQAAGLVNDHAPECCIRPVAEAQRQAFRIPGQRR